MTKTLWKEKSKALFLPSFHNQLIGFESILLLSQDTAWLVLMQTGSVCTQLKDIEIGKQNKSILLLSSVG
jgi:hypothetical protein